MPDLDQIWTSMLDEASLRAFNSGHSELADFLRLKLANDTIRRSGTDWLFDTLVGLAFELQRSYRNLKIVRTSPHSFKRGLSTMVGSLVEIQYGVRCLSVDAGWARTPSDGVMRNQALAQSRFRHFGMAADDIEYRLVRGDLLPVWLSDRGDEIDTNELRRHLALLLDH